MKRIVAFLSLFMALSVNAEDKKIVAVADIALGNPTAKLVYKKEMVRDVVTQAVHKSKQFKVIDWARLSSVLFRRNMEWSDVSDDEEKRAEIQEVLLNDYFLTGTISNFSERVDYDGGAFSKSKTQVANIQLDLFLKDAITNEVIAATRAMSEEKAKIKQNLGFGAGRGANLKLSQDVLNKAVDKAIKELIQELKAK